MIDDRLTDDIEARAIARPMFKTDIATTDGGHEVRNSRWRYPRFSFEFNLAPDQYDSSYYRAFCDLFMAAGGDAECFRFTHWADHAGVDDAMEAVDGSATVFQIMRNYTRGATTRRRKILLPIEDTVTIKIGGVEQASGFAIDYEGGTVTFDSAPGSIPTASFEFDVPVRFDGDSVDLIGIALQLEQPVSVVLKEVRDLE